MEVLVDFVEVLTLVLLLDVFVDDVVVAAAPVLTATVYLVVVSLTLVPMKGSVPAWRTERYCEVLGKLWSVRLT